MTVRERGFLLLTSHLGEPDRRPLTTAQMRNLAQRLAAADTSPEDRELREGDIRKLGFGGEMAMRIVSLLGDGTLLDRYLRRAEALGCVPVTRVSPGYPRRLRNVLGLEAPGCLWARGDLSLLEYPGVSLAGSRDLRNENLVFAREVGFQAAKQGYVLISGNARGADEAAEESCLAAGGRVISVVPDELLRHKTAAGVLYLSEDGFDLPFTPARALSRNRVIYSLGESAFVAQCARGTGGTWDGAVRALRLGRPGVFCFDDGSDAVQELKMLGAEGISVGELHDLSGFKSGNLGLFDQ